MNDHIEVDALPADAAARCESLQARVQEVREQRALLDAQVADLLDQRREAAREAMLAKQFDARVARLEERMRDLELALRTYQ